MICRTLAIVARTVALAAIAAGCDNFPKDPRDSFEKATTTGLRVGVINDAPWARFDGDSASGIEADIIKGFAGKHNMEVRWVAGSAHSLMPALEEGELHIVIGGMTKDSPFKELVGFTNPYCKEEVVICGLAGSSDIKDKEIGVAAGSGLAAYVKKKRGIPVYVDSLQLFSGPVADTRSSYRQTQHQDCSEPIKTLHHVMAVAKGENQLLLKLEEHINETGPR